MKRYLIGLFFIAAFAAIAIECGSSPEEISERHLLVVVNDEIFEPLEPSLKTYAEAVELEQFIVHVESWAPGTIDELKGLIYEHVDLNGIEGALLIGDMPVFWYEQEAFGGAEEFPTDIYLQDRDAIWIDQDNDGMGDFHTELELDIYTSRLNGTEEQLQRYFERSLRYRREGSLVTPSAYIFFDDDWSHLDTSDAARLTKLYGTVDIVKDKDDSTLANYLEKLTGDGAEFVYQWVHGNYRGLHFSEEEDGQPIIKQLLPSDVESYNLKASFINMCNCWAARFTHTTLAQAFTVGTDYGLAIIGSTKVGHIRDPRGFHDKLAMRLHWGEAYRQWFNEIGKSSDTWHLGLMIMGDPLLKVASGRIPKGLDQATSGTFPDD